MSKKDGKKKIDFQATRIANIEFALPESRIKYIISFCKKYPEFDYEVLLDRVNDTLDKKISKSMKKRIELSIKDEEGEN